jgi:micrococcal nuclease
MPTNEPAKARRIPRVPVSMLAAIVAVMSAMVWPAQAVSQPASAPASRPTSVRIVEVPDGDTLKDSSGGRVRLMGVSCPEVDQPFGEAAQRLVEERALGRTVELVDDPVNAKRNHQDRYGRRLAYVRLPEDGTDLSRAIIAAGLGWYDLNNRSTRKLEYLGVENEARKAQLGIWKPLPEPDGSRLVRVAPSGYSYHPPNCIHLRKTKQPKSMTVNAAKAAGYRPCSRYAGP